MRVFKYMKGYTGLAVLIALLLLVQAFCDLSLPGYTSDIIDTGIQNKGVKYALPTKIRSTTLLFLEAFLTEEEKTEIEEIYQKKDDRKEEIRVRRFPDGKDAEEMDKKYTAAWIISSGMLARMEEAGTSFQDQGMAGAGNASGTSEEELAKAGEEAKKQMDAMGEDMVHSMAVQYTIKEEQACGIDLDVKQTRYLWAAGGKMLVMAFLMAIAAILVGFFASRIGAGIGRDLRGKLYTKIMSFSDAEMNRFSSASLITRSTNDVQQIQMVETMMLRMVLYAPVIGIGGIIKVAQTKSGMGWIIALAVVCLFVVIMGLLRLAMPKFKRMQSLVDRVNLVSREILTGLSVIRAFGREQKEEERFEDANMTLTKNMLFTNRVMSFMMPCMMFIMYGVSVLIVWVAADKIDQGTIQVGTMTAFITYSMQIVMAFLMLTALSVFLPRASVASERIDEVLDTNLTIMDKPDAKPVEKAGGVVAFKNVSFSYPGSEEPVLKGITFTARPGEVTAVIGGTGSGKSTLINLIPRFYDVTEGSILLDGVDIRDIAQESLRDQIGYVPQKGMLFSGTIESNMKYGKEDATRQEIEEAVEIAQAKEIVDGKEEGYGSHIAQGGNNVSGGQKQRFSIARAIVRNPKIYIFDDSFSALDYKTDAALRKALGRKTKDATVFIVAQRISTILHAEQIIVLEDGCIAGIGNHKELLESCEVYQEIAKSQLSETELSGLGTNGTSDRENEQADRLDETGKEDAARKEAGKDE